MGEIFGCVAIESVGVAHSGNSPFREEFELTGRDDSGGVKAFLFFLPFFFFF